MVNNVIVSNSTPENWRLQKLDILRAIALIGMLVFHFSWDLAYFKYISADKITTGWLVDLAHVVASSFLFLSGFSLYIAHGKKIRWHSFARRLFLIILSASLVSLVTFLIIPNNFIYFGILHEIALTSLIGLLFLRTPWLINIIIAVAIIYAPNFLPPVFSSVFLWLGLNPSPPSTFDYVPFFPWSSAVLLGITLAQLMDKFNILFLLKGGIKPNFLNRILQWFGRHSLFIYLIHQPILMAILLVGTSIMPPHQQTLTEIRVDAENECRLFAGLELEKNVKFCSCFFDDLDNQGLLADFLYGRINLTDKRIEIIRSNCNISTYLLEENDQVTN